MNDSDASVEVLRTALKAEIGISMDGRGRALDNVFVERLWRTVKYEEVYVKDYATVREAERSLDAFFRFYDEERLHQALDYQTPAEVYRKRKTMWHMYVTHGLGDGNVKPGSFRGPAPLSPQGGGAGPCPSRKLHPASFREMKPERNDEKAKPPANRNAFLGRSTLSCDAAEAAREVVQHDYEVLLQEGKE